MNVLFAWMIVTTSLFLSVDISIFVRSVMKKKKLKYYSAKKTSKPIWITQNYSAKKTKNQLVLKWTWKTGENQTNCPPRSLVAKHGRTSHDHMAANSMRASTSASTSKIIADVTVRAESFTSIEGCGRWRDKTLKLLSDVDSVSISFFQRRCLQSQWVQPHVNNL